MRQKNRRADRRVNLISFRLRPGAGGLKLAQMNFALPPAPQPFLKIAGSGQRFAVRRIYCVGQNYAAHAREMGADTNAPPFFFSKPADALVPDGARIPYPMATENLHYEAELVVAIGAPGANIARTDALNHVWGYCAGIDLTRRDLQGAAKAAGRPWDMAKGFDRSAPCGALHSAADVGHLSGGSISLRLNGDIRQASDLADMIWPVPDIIACLSTYQELAPGDLIFTGTPAGVGPMQRGDRAEVQIATLSPVSVTII